MERFHDATINLLNTPTGIPDQLLDKFEVLEELVTQERTMGESAANYPVIALASVKRDLLNMEGLVLARHALLDTAAA